MLFKLEWYGGFKSAQIALPNSTTFKISYLSGNYCLKVVAFFENVYCLFFLLRLHSILFLDLRSILLRMRTKSADQLFTKARWKNSIFILKVYACSNLEFMSRLMTMSFKTFAIRSKTALILQTLFAENLIHSYVL